MSIALVNEIAKLNDRLDAVEEHAAKLTTALSVESAKRAELAQRIAAMEDRRKDEQSAKVPYRAQRA